MHPHRFLPPTIMNNRDDLSTLPPATLRAALEASVKRVEGKKEETKKEIRRLQNRLKKLERGEDASESEHEVEPDRNVASGSRREEKRPMVVDSSSDEKEQHEHQPRPIAKARKPAHDGPASFQG